MFRKPKQDVVAHVVDIATNAGTKVYHMAKDVFQTLQAKNNVRLLILIRYMICIESDTSVHAAM